MIKAAAVAGLGAWTAPVIIDSLASPAAAVTHICDFYVFHMTHSGNSGNCVTAIDTGTCPTPSISGATAACSSFARQTSTTAPVNFTNTACTGGTSESVTFTINTAGRSFAGTATSGGLSTSSCLASVTLTAASGTSVTLTNGSVDQNGVWFAYLAIA
jgi:hypothetical protein